MSGLRYILLTLSFLLYNVRVHSLLVRLTPNGYVKGIELASAFGQRYVAFRSVPYAEPPITGKDPYTGRTVDRRFKAPEPLKRSWPGMLRVGEFANSCETTRIMPVVQEHGEDCLYLNIYVPSGGAEKKTVLIWLHGGGFAGGGHREALYGPDFLLADDNIVVAVQFRLGIFGFLNLGHGNYTGNMGLKDQQLALKWIYENIELFSGNKDQILLFGESAGGASTTYHMLNEESRKYFTRALVMSGSAYSYFAFTEMNHRDSLVECAHTKDVNQMIKFIRVADVRDLIQCRFEDNWGPTLHPEFVPTMEPKGTVNGLVTEPSEDIWTSSKAPVIDTMFTMANQEQITFDPEFLSINDPLIDPDGESEIILPFEELTDEIYPRERKDALVKLYKAYYSGAKDEQSIKKANIALMSDLNFNWSVLKAVKQQAKANGQRKKTYLMRFGMNDRLNWVQRIQHQLHAGTGHSEELCYIF